MRKGFTLIELLIAIVIIGILSSTLLLSSTSATSSARALTIINDLRTMKEAALLLYLDSMDIFESSETVIVGDANEVIKTALKNYLDNPDRYDNNYGVKVDGTTWYVTYDTKNLAGGNEIRARLAGRAKSSGLVDESGGMYTSAKEKVCMRAR